MFLHSFIPYKSCKAVAVVLLMKQELCTVTDETAVAVVLTRCSTEMLNTFVGLKFLCIISYSFYKTHFIQLVGTCMVFMI